MIELTSAGTYESEAHPHFKFYAIEEYDKDEIPRSEDLHGQTVLIDGKKQVVIGVETNLSVSGRGPFGIIVFK